VCLCISGSDVSGFPVFFCMLSSSLLLLGVRSLYILCTVSVSSIVEFFLLYIIDLTFTTYDNCCIHRPVGFPISVFILIIVSLPVLYL